MPPHPIHVGSYTKEEDAIFRCHGNMSRIPNEATRHLRETRETKKRAADILLLTGLLLFSLLFCRASRSGAGHRRYGVGRRGKRGGRRQRRDGDAVAGWYNEVQTP